MIGDLRVLSRSHRINLRTSLPFSETKSVERLGGRKGVATGADDHQPHVDVSSQGEQEIQNKPAADARERTFLLPARFPFALATKEPCRRTHFENAPSEQVDLLYRCNGNFPRRTFLLCHNNQHERNGEGTGGGGGNGIQTAKQMVKLCCTYHMQTESAELSKQPQRDEKICNCLKKVSSPALFIFQMRRNEWRRYWGDFIEASLAKGGWPDKCLDNIVDYSWQKEYMRFMFILMDTNGEFNHAICFVGIFCFLWDVEIHHSELFCTTLRTPCSVVRRIKNSKTLKKYELGQE